MRFGLFGKLQAKRDFIAVATPRSFLSVWEPWLQGCISASRMQLADKWQNAFLTAPVWRFWLGAEICGEIVAGALMPSMDGVGRYFPLTFLAFAEPGDRLPPPEIDPCESWFAAIEEFLFVTLDATRPYEAITQALTAFPPPAAANPEWPAGLTVLAPRPGIVSMAEDGFATAFSRARIADAANASAGMSFWWTAGGEGYPPHALAAPRLPDPYLYAAMLTGAFADAAPQPVEAP